MSNRPSGLRPPSKVSSQTSHLPLSSSNIPNIRAAGRPRDEATGSTASASVSSSRATSSYSLSSLHGKDHSTSFDLSSHKYTKARSAEFGWTNRTRRFFEDSNVDHYLDPDGEVLNNDTDSYIIGETVWVGGVKRGKIAFIGETQFGKGDWGGVVLDEPIGKNDGSVSGHRYFQCEPNHGTFVRLTRLTREPSHEVLEQRSPSPRSMMTPGRGSPGLTTPRVGGAGGHLKLDERVIVQSSTGTKKGILRFIGETEFANGEWAGIELDNPVGKNDGSIGGKRYFHCKEKYGLFAPIHKVTSSPANRHSSGGLRRHGSRESMTSNLSSVASSMAYRGIRKPMVSKVSSGGGAQCLPSCSLQAVLKEKEKHLEHLIQERELDRQELAQNMLKLEDSKEELSSIKLEYAKFMDDSSRRNATVQSELDALKKGDEAQKVSLEEIQRKYEDLLFTYEEDQISRAELESQLQMATEQLHCLAQQNVKETVAQASDSINELVNEKQVIKEELKKSKEDLDKKHALIMSLESSLSKLESEISVKSDEAFKYKTELEKVTILSDELGSKLSTLECELHKCRTEREQDLKTGKIELESIQKSSCQELNLYKSENNALKKELKEKDSLMTNLQAANVEFEKYKEMRLKDEERQSMETKNVVKNLEETQIKCNNLESLLQASTTSQQQSVEALQKSKIEVEQLGQKLHVSNEKVAQLEIHLEQLKVESKGTTSEIQEKNKQIVQQLMDDVSKRDKQVLTLTSETDALKASLSELKEKMKQKEEASSHELGIIKGANESLTKDLELAKAEATELSVSHREDVSQLETLRLQITALSKTLEDKQSIIFGLEKSQNDLKKSLDSLEQIHSEDSEKHKLELKKVTNELKESLELCTNLKTAVENSKTDAEKKRLEDCEKHKLELEKVTNELKESREKHANLQNIIENSKNDVEKKRLEEGQKHQLESEKLTNELKEGRELCASLKNDIQNSKTEAEEKLSTQSEAHKAEKEQLIKEINFCKENILKLEKNLELGNSKSTEETNKTQQELKSLNEIITTNNEKIKTLLSEQQVLKAEFEDSITKLIERDRLLAKISKELNATKENNQSLQKELDTLKTQEFNLVAAHRDEISRLTASHNEALNSMQKLSSQKQNEKSLIAINPEQQANSMESTKNKTDTTNSEAHINFLNSIIVDLQKEKEKLNEKVEILLQGGHLPDSNRNVTLGSGSHTGKDLRLYCDICEEFDIHDTEDCPKQCTDSDLNSKHSSTRGTERPYCDVCEVFGHWTSACDDGETF